MNETTERLFKTALLGDLSASEALVREVQRGSLAGLEIGELASLAEEISQRWVTVAGSLKQAQLSRTLRWVKKSTHSRWHLVDETQEDRCLCPSSIKPKKEGTVETREEFPPYYEVCSVCERALSRRSSEDVWLTYQKWKREAWKVQGKPSRPRA